MAAASCPEDYKTLWKGTVTVRINEAEKFISNLNLRTYSLDLVTCSSKSNYARKNLEWSCEVSEVNREFSFALVLKTVLEEDVICFATYTDRNRVRSVTETAKSGHVLKLEFNNDLYCYSNFESFNFNVDVLSKSPPAHGAPPPPPKVEALPEYLRAQSTTADEYISKMFNNQEFSDVTIQAKDSEYSAHKLILGQSPVFAKMLQAPMQEGLSNVIEIKDVDPVVVALMLEFMYKREPDIPEDRGQLLQLLDLAERYDLPELKKSCFEKMALTLSDDNAADFNVAAWRYSGVEQVREYFNDYCRRRMPAIGQLEGSKQLIRENLDAFF